MADAVALFTHPLRETNGIEIASHAQSALGIATACELLSKLEVKRTPEEAPKNDVNDPQPSITMRFRCGAMYASAFVATGSVH